MSEDKRSFAERLEFHYGKDVWPTTEAVALEATLVRQRAALQFVVALWDEGGNGEGWTLKEVVERARAALEGQDA